MTLILAAGPIVDSEISELTLKVKNLKRIPKLAIILVGDNPASQIYVGNKIKQAKVIGAQTELIELPNNVSADQFLKTVKAINENKTITGALIQLPLPTQLKDIDVSSLINPEKDVDGFHPINIAKLYLGKPGIKPCTPMGIVALLNHYKIPVEGRDIVIIGRSNIVGKPLALLLTHLNATVTFCHSKTKNLIEHTKRADIIVSAVGSPKFLTKNYFRNDKTQTLIDVGITKTKGGIFGDMDFNTLSDNCYAITPVPGGIGPLTVLSLLKNLIKTAEDK